MRKIIAILRGITPQEVCTIAEILIQNGINIIEVPLNSPNALQSIESMVNSFGKDGIFGAGTVINKEQVQDVYNCGGRIIVSPNCDVDVIRETKARNLLSYPGVFTVSECFSALNNGADGLKFFPSILLKPEGYQSVKAVLPADCNSYAVGGVDKENFANWFRVGMTGFGVGSSIYKIGDTPQQVFEKTKSLVTAFDAASSHIFDQEIK